MYVVLKELLGDKLLVQYDGCGHKILDHKQHISKTCRTCKPTKATKASLSSKGNARSASPRKKKPYATCKKSEEITRIGGTQWYRVHKDSFTSTFVHRCGSTVTMDNANMDSVGKCKFCMDNPKVMSFVYMVKVTLGGKSWLKVGMSRSIGRRICFLGREKPRKNAKNYLRGANYEVLDVIPCKDKKESANKERNIHNEMNYARIPSNTMIKKGMRTGVTECYPMKEEAMVRIAFNRQKDSD